MNGVLFALMIVAMLLTAGVLLVGMLSFAVGGKFGEKHSNKLMRLRVLCQGIALGFFVLVMLLAD